MQIGNAIETLAPIEWFSLQLLSVLQFETLTQSTHYDYQSDTSQKHWIKYWKNGMKCIIQYKQNYKCTLKHQVTVVWQLPAGQVSRDGVL